MAPVSSLPDHEAGRALQYPDGKPVVREPCPIFEDLEVEIEALEQALREAPRPTPHRDVLGVDDFLYDPHALPGSALAEILQCLA